MSAPDPKAWALTEDEAEEIGDAVDLYGPDSPEFLVGFEMVARRRAIAELKALANVLCFACGKGYAKREVETDRIWGHIQHSSEVDREVWSPHFWCEAQQIHDRIAAIEAEG